MTPTTEIRYDPQPNALVIYADIQPLPGAPPQGMKCLYETVPRLRVWGDGLVFLDVSEYGKKDPPLWTGQFSQSQMVDTLAFLDMEGFLDSWTPAVSDVPNPAGTSITLGVYLKTRTIIHGSGNMDWPLYTELINKLLSDLTPLIIQPETDSRITKLNIGSRVCSTPTAAP
jgi:hypothetical protein